MKYEILASDIVFALEEQVIEYIKDGWVPQGGVACFDSGYDEKTDDDNFMIYQAMIKLEE